MASVYTWYYLGRVRGTEHFLKELNSLCGSSSGFMYHLTISQKSCQQRRFSLLLVLWELEMGSLGINERKTNQTKVVLLVGPNREILFRDLRAFLHLIFRLHKDGTQPHISSQSPIPPSLSNLVSPTSLFFSSPEASVSVSPPSPGTGCSNWWPYLGLTQLQFSLQNVNDDLPKTHRVIPTI